MMENDIKGKDLCELLGINYIELDKLGNVVLIKGVAKARDLKREVV